MVKKSEEGDVPFGPRLQRLLNVDHREGDEGGAG